MDVSDDKWWNKNTSIGQLRGRTIEKYKCMSFTTKTASKYKYQTAIETTEQNTSKRVNAKESVLQNVCKYLSFFFDAKVTAKQ